MVDLSTEKIAELFMSRKVWEEEATQSSKLRQESFSNSENGSSIELHYMELGDANKWCVLDKNESPLCYKVNASYWVNIRT